MTYFVIYGSADGGQIQTCKDEAELRQFLEDNDYKFFHADFKDEPMYWSENACAIIKGDIIRPKEKKVVKEWDFG